MDKVEDELRDVVYRLVGKLEPYKLDLLKNALQLQILLVREGRKISIVKVDGFISVIAYVKKNGAWLKKWDFELMPTANHWTVTGMTHVDLDVMELVDEEKEFEKLTTFVIDFEEDGLKKYA